MYGVAAEGKRKIPTHVVTSQRNSIQDNIVSCISEYRRGLDWMIRFIAPYTFTQLWTTENYSAVAILHTFQFTAPHALGFSVFTSRILATDFSQSHCNFKSHVKSSCHSLIPFLPFLLNHLLLPSPERDPVLDYCSILRQSQSQSYFTTGGLRPISSSWHQAPGDSRPAQSFWDVV
jgi:hypothetical protein